MLLIINFTYAIETNQEASKKNWYNINNTLAYRTIKNLPEYPILYSQEIISDAKDRLQKIKPILFVIATNLLVRIFFNLDVNANLIAYTFKFLLCDSFLTLIKPSIATDEFLNIIMLYMQIFAEVAIRSYVMVESYGNIPTRSTRLPALISFFATSCIICKDFHNLIQSKELPDAIDKQDPKMSLLNKLVKKEAPMFLYSSEYVMEALDDDRYFIKINKWVASHKNDISFYNLFSADENGLMNQQEFANNNQIVKAKENYYIIPKKHKSCVNLKLKLEFSHKYSKEVINKENIIEILTEEGNYIIEANKEIENYKISKDLQNDKHQYITIVNHQGSHYLLIGLQFPSNSWKTTFINKLFWPVFFKDIPFNTNMTLTIKLQNTQEVIDILEDIIASFQECNSRMGIFKLKNIKKEELAELCRVTCSPI
jgi:hypothetical protein